MNLIVVVDKNWGIGKQGGLLFRLKKDMQFFRQTTTGKVVVMGANTFKSFPNGALANRVNIVLDDSGAQYPNTISVATVQQMDSLLQNYADNDVFVIGGASFYKFMLPRCKTAYVTKVDADGEAELFFPDLDNLENWHCVEQGNWQQDGDYKISFCRYENGDIK